ncbi:hypothetical protein HAX54_025252 [Datura stramonium]|uniref:Uncharacterized protein n=1 Tax=Datura stramonium TaxID=4076 RepID=A0ABS8V1B6_DATST|nr:hypothetical protein [Datura stramonium]
MSFHCYGIAVVVESPLQRNDGTSVESWELASYFWIHGICLYLGLVSTAAENTGHLVLKLTKKGELWKVFSGHIGVLDSRGEDLQDLLYPLPHTDEEFVPRASLSFFPLQVLSKLHVGLGQGYNRSLHSLWIGSSCTGWPAT